MRNRVERLRIWLLAGAVLLVVVIAAFIGIARERSGGRGVRPPRGFGVDTETANPTYSHSVGGKTIYTIRAARQIKHSDGKFTLREVAVELYGQKQDRLDRIYGDEFEYDEKAGVVRAVGVVHIDLQAAAAEGKAGRGKDDAKAARVLHATTSGLVYVEKLGVAATDQEIQFQLGELTGTATGADYTSDSGMLALHSAVRVNGTAGRRPVLLTAATALLDNRSQETTLTQAKYVSPGETVQADRAMLHTRADGSAERLEAWGDVRLGSDRGMLRAESADVMLGATSQPQTAKLAGHLRYGSDEPARQTRAEADGGTVDFDAQGRPVHAVFAGSVRMTERVRVVDTKSATAVWNVRDLTAAKVDAVLIQEDRKQTRLTDAEATGNAHLTVMDEGDVASAKDGSKPRPARKEIAADDLKTHLVTGADGTSLLDSVSGRGRTELRQVDARGIEQASMGDSLEVKFAVPAAGTQGERRQEIESAVQMSHVAMTRFEPAKPGAKSGEEDHATAERAQYDGGLERLTLVRGVRLMKPGSVLWADRVTVDRESGDADADGAVRVSYLKPDEGKTGAGKTAGARPVGAGAQPEEAVHILAARAHLDHEADVATFYGDAGRPARLWKAGSQVEAQVIEFNRAQRRMTAHGDGQAEAVHTVMVTTGTEMAGTGRRGAAKAGVPATSVDHASTPKAVKQGASHGPQAVRIASRTLVYADAARRADFTGGVKAESAESTMVAEKATVYLEAGSEPVGAAGQADPLASFSGSIERIVATGKIAIDQPGRHATGGEAVYTASDGLFVLTGEGKALPRVVDAAGNSTTGTSLRFHSGDDSVEVSGAPTVANGPAERVHTEMKAKQ